MSGAREQRRNGAAFNGRTMSRNWPRATQLKEALGFVGANSCCACVRVDRQLTSTLGGHASGEINNITCAFILWRLEFRD